MYDWTNPWKTTQHQIPNKMPNGSFLSWYQQNATPQPVQAPPQGLALLSNSNSPQMPASDPKQLGWLGRWWTGNNSDGSANHNNFTGMQKLFGGENNNGKKTVGAVPTAMGLGMTALQGYIGFEQLKMAKEQQKHEMANWTSNFNAQAKQANQSLDNRARNLQNAGAIESAEDYVAKYKIDEK